MAEHPGITVTVSRFQPNRAAAAEEDAAADEAAVEAFKARVAGAGAEDDGSVRFEEREARSREEVVEAIVLLSKCNVFVVGRMPPTAPLVEHADELGPVGSYLASPEFKTSASVLVIKRYDPATNPASKRFDPRARPPVATEVEDDDEELGSGGGSASVVPVQWTPTHDAA
jgi:ABC-type branched-subunit amino acid transport system substrate-binding protein